MLLWVGPSPRACEVPYCSRPSHPPRSAQGQGHRKGQHLDQPWVRSPCVGGRLSGPKLRSTAIVGGRRACRLGEELGGASSLTLGTGVGRPPSLRLHLGCRISNLPAEGCPPPPAPLHIHCPSVSPCPSLSLLGPSSGRLCFLEIPGHDSLLN